MTKRRIYESHETLVTAEAERLSASEYIEEFRQQTETSTPTEWLAYIDAITTAYPVQHKQGILIVDLLPAHDKSMHSLRVLRKLRETNRPFDSIAVMVHRYDHHTSSRLAIVPGETPDYLSARRAGVVDGRLVTWPSPDDDHLRAEFDKHLKNYKVAKELIVKH